MNIDYTNEHYMTIARNQVLYASLIDRLYTRYERIED